MRYSERALRPPLPHGGIRLRDLALLPVVVVILALSNGNAVGAEDKVRQPGYMTGQAFVYAGDTINVRCMPPSDFDFPAATPKWITPGLGAYKDERWHHHMWHGAFVLRIQAARVRDSGAYQFHMDYINKTKVPVTFKSSMEVRILPRTPQLPAIRKPHIAKAPRTAVVGHTLQATCVVRDLFSPVFSWSCTGVKAESGRMFFDAFTGQLTVRSVQGSDAGICTCSVSGLSNQSSFSFSVVNRFDRPPHITFIPEDLYFTVQYPYTTGPLPELCLVRFKYDGHKLDRFVRCKARKYDGGNPAVYFTLHEDFFFKNETSLIKSLLGKQVAVKVAIVGVKPGRWSSVKTVYLPLEPVLPGSDEITTHPMNCSQAGGVHGVEMNVLRLSHSPHKFAAYLPILSYQMFVCEENESMTQCDNSESPWEAAGRLHHVRHGYLPNEVAEDLCLVNIMPNRNYRFMFRVNTLSHALSFASVSHPMLYPDPNSQHLITTSRPPPTPNLLRQKYVHVPFGLKRTFSCQQDEMKNASLMSKNVMDYFLSVCKCNGALLGKRFFSRKPVAGKGCSPTRRRGEDKIAHELLLDVDRCSFLHSISSAMAKVGGTILIPGDSLSSQSTFTYICIDISHFSKDSCPGIEWNVEADSTLGDKFHCLRPHNFQKYDSTPAVVTALGSSAMQAASSVFVSRISAGGVEEAVVPGDDRAINNTTLIPLIVLLLVVVIPVLLIVRHQRKKEQPCTVVCVSPSCVEEEQNNNSGSGRSGSDHQSSLSAHRADLHGQALNAGIAYTATAQRPTYLPSSTTSIDRGSSLASIASRDAVNVAGNAGNAAKAHRQLQVHFFDVSPATQPSADGGGESLSSAASSPCISCDCEPDFNAREARAELTAPSNPANSSLRSQSCPSLRDRMASS
eukprot:scpid24670/ scgid18358/ 